MVQIATKSLVTTLHVREKSILLALKSLVAFSWGFVDAVVYIETRRFSTMMSGNTLILAVETSKWKGQEQEMMFTISLILLYICGGAVYDALLMVCKGDNGRVLQFFALPAIVLMGIIADVIQFAIGSCSGKDTCSGNYLYFLTPMSFLTGTITSYFGGHPDGIVTNMVTGHMKVLPKAIVEHLLRGQLSLALEKGLASASITFLFFVGCLSGSLASEPILKSYHPNGHFSPIFMVVSFVLGSLCLLHYTVCERFCCVEKERQEQLNLLQEKQEAV